jgi:plasmid stabilization system protein ParE
MRKNLNLGIIGIDHGHIFDMLDEMLKEGCTCDYFWTDGSPLTLKEFNQKYPNIKRVKNKSEILNNNKIDMILISSIPKDRAINSIEALKSGKDVMVDKPGCTTLDQLEDLKRTVKQTGKIWSVNFSERFHVAAVAKAEQLVAEGKIGKVKQTMGTGPHRQGNYERPNWFYERESYGGINLTGNGGHGYIRLDWFTPDALPTWGDGRLFILGDKGFIEIRKYTDLAKSDTGNHLYYANNEEVKHLDCRDVMLPYFGNLINDVLNRTETACSQELTYLTMELAIKAQEIAEKK